METAYTFDDVMFEPQYSDILSRKEVDLTSSIGNVSLELPLVSANMADITEESMVSSMNESGGLGIMHRFMTIKKNVKMFKRCVNSGVPANKVGVSVGVGEYEKKRFAKLLLAGARTFCIDVAHGHHIHVKNILDWISQFSEYQEGELTIIAGNVASVEGAMALHKWGANAIKVGVGPGCFASGTRILMSNGLYKNIESVKVGDFVINMHGEAVKVKRAFSTGIRDVQKIRSSISYKPSYVTLDHQYFVGDLNSVSKKSLQSYGYVKALSKKTKSKDSKYKWKRVEDFRQDALLTPRNINFDMGDFFSINLKKKGGDDVTLTPSYDLGYIYGTFLGDGHARVYAHKKISKYTGKTIISNSGNVSWYFSIHEDSVARKLNSCVEKVFNRSCKIEKVCEKSIIKVDLYYKPFANFLESFGKKDKKNLPEEVFVNDKRYLKGILDGLIDSDGSVEKGGRISFTNTSPNLIELFGVICFITKGFFPNMREHGKNAGGLKGVNENNLKMSFRSRINTTSTKRLSKDFQISKLLESSPTDLSVEVFDLEVDCPSHRFIANNAVVHNSCCQTRENTGVGIPQLSLLKSIREAFDDRFRPSIIADGGIKKTGDMGKALVYADAIMVGGFLAGTSETPGKVYKTMQGEFYKTMAGSASAEAKVKHGKKQEFVEGGIRQVPFRGHVKYILQNAKENVRSTLSYSGARNLDEFREKCVLVKISGGGKKESKF